MKPLRVGKKSLVKISFILFLIVFSVSFLVLLSFQKEEVKAQVEEDSMTEILNPNTERTCVGNRCVVEIGSAKYILNKTGEYEPFDKVVKMVWQSFTNTFNISKEDEWWVNIEPFVIYNGNYKTIEDIKNAFPDVNLKDYVSFTQAHKYKFALNYSDVPDALLENVDYLGFKLLNSKGLTWDDVKKESGHRISIKGDVFINYRDLIESTFTLDFVNKTYLLIGNISMNAENGVVYLDPTVELETPIDDAHLDEGNPDDNAGTSIYLYVVKTLGLYRTMINFDISTIPNGSIINSARLDLNYSYVPGAGKTGLNVSHITNSSPLWSEDDTTWNNHNDAYSMDTITHNLSRAENTGDWQNFTVTDIVQAWINESIPRAGFMVTLENEAATADIYHRFSSKDDDIAPAPRLVVDYALPSGENYTSIKLRLNDTEANQTLTYGQVSNISATINVTGLNVELYMNDTLINNDTTTSENITDINWFKNATYNITAYYPGNATYNSSNITLWVFVEKGGSASNLHLALNDTEGDATQLYPEVVNATGWSVITANVIHYSIYRNDTNVTTLGGSENPASEEILLGNATYNYTYWTPGNENYTAGQIERLYRVEKGAVQVNISLNGTINDLTQEYPKAVNITAWKNSTIGQYNISLYRNDSIISSSTSSDSVYEGILLGNATYNVSLVFNGSANYTDDSIVNRWYRVEKKDADVQLNPENQTITYETQVNQNCTIKATLVSCSIYRNVSTLPESNNTDITLGVGDWIYVANLSDSVNYSNWQMYSEVTVNAKSVTVKLALNDTEDDVTQSYPEAVNATGWNTSTFHSDSYYNMTLWRNDTIKSSTITGVSVNEEILLGNATYNYTITLNSTNYTATKVERWYRVEKGSPVNYLKLALNDTEGDVTQQYPEVVNSTAWSTINSTITDNVVMYTLWRNSTNITTLGGTQDPISEEILLGNATYNYTYSVEEYGNFTDGQLGRLYRVEKGFVQLNLSLNDTDGDITQQYPEAINATTWKNSTTDSQFNISLYRNDTIVSSSTSLDSLSENILLGNSTYNYTAFFNGSINYTDTSTVRFYRVERADVSLNLALNGTEADRAYTYPEDVNASGWRNSTFNNEGNISLWRNDTIISSLETSDILIVSENIKLTNSTHNYTLTFTAGNYSNNSIVNRYVRINKGSTLAYLYINGSRSDMSFFVDEVANFTVTLDVSGKYLNISTNISDWVEPVDATTDSVFENITTFTLDGFFNITGYFEGDENYTSSKEEWTAMVGRKIAGIGAYVYFLEIEEFPIRDVTVILKNTTHAWTGGTSDDGKIFFNVSLGIREGNYTLELEPDTVPDFLTGEFTKNVVWYEGTSVTIPFELEKLDAFVNVFVYYYSPTGRIPKMDQEVTFVSEEKEAIGVTDNYGLTTFKIKSDKSEEEFRLRLNVSEEFHKVKEFKGKWYSGKEVTVAIELKRIEIPWWLHPTVYYFFSGMTPENISKFFLSNPLYIVLIGVIIISSPIVYMIIREQLRMRNIELKLPKLWWFRKRFHKMRPRKKSKIEK